MGKRAPSTTDDRSDAELLAAVAKDRCRDAFAELVKRYQRSAYNLARHIILNDALAEEAAQEAMLRVWLAAKNFKAGGNAQGWIHQIVVREALTIVRTRRVNTERVQRAARLLPQAPETQTPEADRTELLVSLRGGLSELPELNRQLVALYFGAGLSQAQVGQSLNMSQRTVGHKLEESLKLLRARLAQVGFAAAAPALLDDSLAQAVRTGMEPPADLLANVMDGLDRAAAAVAKHSARAAAAKSSSAALWVVLAVAAAAAGGTAWWLNREAPVAPVAPAAQAAQAIQAEPLEPPAEKSEATKNVAVEKEPGLIARWDFAQAPAGKDFRVFSGRWVWTYDTMLKQKAMANASSEETMAALLPARLPKRPFVVTIHYTALKSGLPTLGLRWTQEQTMLPYAKHLFPNKEEPRRATLISYDYYFFDRYFLIVHKEELAKVGVYNAPYPGEALAFVTANMVTSRIEIREADIEDFPPAARAFAQDPEAAIKRIKQWKVAPGYPLDESAHAPETE